MLFTSASRSALLRSYCMTNMVHVTCKRTFAASSSGIAASVESLKGVHFMSIDQLRCVRETETDLKPQTSLRSQ